MKKIQILLVEDEKRILNGLSMFLDYAGYEVVCAENGAEALQIVKEHCESNRNFDLMITDLQMPYVNGFQLIEKLNKMNLLPMTMIMSGYGDQEAISQLTRRFSAEFIAKPFSPEAMLKQMEIFMRREEKLVS